MTWFTSSQLRWVLARLSMGALLLITSQGWGAGLNSALITVTAFPQPGTDTTELICHAAAVSVVPPVAVESVELPSDEELGAMLGPEPTPAGVNTPSLARSAQRNYKVAIFGDSHLAAGVFSRELMRLSQLPEEQIATSFIPATVERAGVRLALRKACALGRWSYEAAYVGNEAALYPGPGLATARALTAEAGFVVDLRDSQGQPQTNTLRVLYHQSEQVQHIAIGIDGGEELTVELPAGNPTAAAIEIRSPKAMARLSLRALSEDFRFQGLQLPVRANTRLTLDVFGYPGATVAAWQKINGEYFAKWFQEQNYDLVVLWYGTNEGNVPVFDARAYESLLTDSLTRLRALFPSSQCLLLSPGDRGVLTRVSTSKRRKRLKLPKLRSALLKYSTIHAQIAAIQSTVAARFGCSAYNLQQAMGGQGSAYRWSKTQPRKMAADLIHFTPQGYKELADDFAQAVHWSALWSDTITTPNP